MAAINNLDNKVHTHIAELHAFDAASRLGSLTKAAEHLNITQPALSQKIKRLETFVGEPLFLRQNRGVKLTPTGKALFEATHTNFQSFRDIFDNIQSRKSTKQVRISTDFAFAGHWLVPRLAGLRSDLHGLDIQVFTSQTPDNPLDFQSDLIISLKQSPTPDTRHHVLFEEEVFAICSPKFLADHGPFQSATDIGNNPLLDLTASPDAGWHNWDSWLKQQGVTKSQQSTAIGLSNYSLVLQAAIKNQGLALGWKGLIEEQLEQKELVIAWPQSVRSDRSYCLQLREDASPHVKKVYSWIKENSA
ncbi:LysR substrate-binding domain-containing protein [Kiloniella majae]|uniref:LysR substrate-binding domain-containing protein n=1 Tax=Kiloniella majae TaxID=1938558 RepID=UPI000A277395|nr:LysR substrate-binding domain-containing protein [Kiloniella majae]